MHFEKSYCERSISFWDNYAKWYDLWIKHNNFHKSVIEFLFKVVEPEWNVLDIGAGNGVLSIPLSQIGCNVTSIEPSIGMRNHFFSEIINKKIQGISIDTRRWEDIPTLWYQGYDLIIACNSLHLMEIPFTASLRKIFAMKPRNVLLITELEKVRNRIVYETNNYELQLARTYYADTSFAYHNLTEAYEHYQSRLSKKLSLVERKNIYKTLIFESGHFWKREETLVGMFYWSRKY